MEVKVSERAVPVLERVGAHGDVGPVTSGEQLPAHSHMPLPPSSITHVQPCHAHHAIKAWNQHGCHGYIRMVSIDSNCIRGHTGPSDQVSCHVVFNA